MLSYRHGFHAGNHADVFKHVTLCVLLDYLQQKDKPLFVVDTHAGRGDYRLDDEQAQKLRESADGIGRLWDGPPAPTPVADYLDRVRRLNGDGELRVYPGSPAFIADSLRPTDRACFFELHPADGKVLRERVAGRDRRVRVRLEDGVAGLKSVLPPPERRALVLIDPAYEIKTDYDLMIRALDDARRRFATGVFALWYPLLERPEARGFGQRLERSGAGKWLHMTLTVRGSTAGHFGMSGSGIFVVNPPWTLHDSMSQALPYLADRLGQDEQAGFSIVASAG